MYIKSYHFRIFDCDKNLITKTFFISDDNNFYCNILEATYTYDRRIANPDIKLIIQWNFSFISHAIT